MQNRRGRNYSSWSLKKTRTFCTIILNTLKLLFNLKYIQNTKYSLDMNIGITYDLWNYISVTNMKFMAEKHKIYSPNFV